MDTDVTARVVSLAPISLNDPSSLLVLLLIFLALAFVAGLLIVLLTRKNKHNVERLPVLGAESDTPSEVMHPAATATPAPADTPAPVSTPVSAAETVTPEPAPMLEPIQEAVPEPAPEPAPVTPDPLAPNPEDLDLSHEDIANQPIPQLGHPDDEGVPVPKYDAQAESLVVDTSIAPVDVNASVPPVPIPEEVEVTGIAGTDDISTPSEDDGDVTESSVFMWPPHKETTQTKEEVDMDTTANEADNQPQDSQEFTAKAASAEDAAADTASAEAAPASPFDSVKIKFEEVKEKTTAFLEGEGEDAPLERIKRAALDVKDKAEELKDKAYEVATSERAQEIRSSLEAKAEEAKEKAVELWEKAKESAQDEDSFLGQAKRAATDVKEKAEDYFSNKTNPREDTGENAE